MQEESRQIRASIVRGGTSKGIFLMEEDLPGDSEERDRVILEIFGSPDVRQIDGLGGADVLTSKLAVIGENKDGRADVDYTFGQVSIDKPFIDYGGNCGNISSAVGGFAIEHGLVEAKEPITEVKIRMTNTDRILKAYIPVENGRVQTKGDYRIDGVPGTGAKIVMDWSDAAGGVTGKLLPTENVQDTIQADGKDYTVSVVDAGNITVFIDAGQLGLKGTESVSQMEENRGVMERIEEIRGKVCEKLKLVERWQDAARITPYQPFFAIISPPQSYTALNDLAVSGEAVDLVSRIIFMGHMHKAYPISGTVATGAASRIEHSLVWEQMRGEAREKEILRIGHPSGSIEIHASGQKDEDCGTRITKLEVSRTARSIMDGTVYLH